MDACKSDQSRQPLLPTEKNNAATAISRRSREVPSRYKSPLRSSTASYTATRCPSPTLSRAGTGSPSLVSKRAQSVERKRPSLSTSPSNGRLSPSRPSTPVNESIDMQITSRKATSSRLGEGLWPSTMRSLSVSFQSDTVSIPVAKKEKPVTSSSVDRTLRPSSNVAASHKQIVEMNPSPLKSKNPSDQSENSKPPDVVRSRLINQHRLPTRLVEKGSLNRSLDLSDKNGRTSSPKSGCSPMRRPFDGEPKARQPSPKRISSLLPSSLSRGVSPSKILRAPSPSRGSSPSKLRASNSSAQLDTSSSVLSFIVDVQKGKRAANYIEDAHQLRLLYNRYLQWRFANALEENVLYCQKVTAEETLFNVWEITLSLRDSVIRKKIGLQQIKLGLHLNAILIAQMPHLEKWTLLERDYISSLAGAVEDLESSTLRLPVTSGARADVESLKSALSSAVDVMQSTGFVTRTLLSGAKETNTWVSDLAAIAAHEKVMLTECESLLAATSAMQVQDLSLKTHVLQLKESLQKGRSHFWEIMIPP